MGRFAVGQPVRRLEDQRLLQGGGRYTDDLKPTGAASVIFLRSPYAHARIVSLELDEARHQPGVLGVFKIADLDAEGIGDNPCMRPVTGKNGARCAQPPRPILARERVRHVGEPVAAVVAETLEQAKDAAEAIAVDYEELPALGDTAAARAESAPQIWAEAPGNLAVDWEKGDKQAVETAFAEAAHVTRLALVNNRIIVNPMEPRAALGDYDEASERFTLTTPTQGSHRLRDWLAERIFKVPRAQMRVLTPDVGGAFGMKIFLYSEQVFVLWAARRLGRPVHWVSERTEGFVSDTQGRDHVTQAALALDAEGRILALEVKTTAALGAYLSTFAPFIPTDCYAMMLSGAYRIPAIHLEVACGFTNTVPVDAYRGAGRPEAIYVVERLVDQAAWELGLSQDEIRRRNFIAPQDLPYRTATGETYDSGDFRAIMERAMTRADWRGFEARRAAACAKGKLRGIAMAVYVEGCGAVGEEEAKLTLLPAGRLRAVIGTQDGGQGHRTAYSQILSERLGLDSAEIEIVQGDSDVLTKVGGTGGSRSLLMGGSAATAAAATLDERARAVASEMLQETSAAIEFADGLFKIAGTDRTLTWADIAHHLEDLGRTLEASAVFQPEATTYPNGCHICEIEVDPDTGTPRVVGYVVVDDFGRLVNPLLVRGQVLGGIAQGLGQALLEDARYDPESGQLVAGSFMDYAMPRADHLPHIDIELVEDYPCRTNALGVKGAGEAGAIGACPAILNALLDALRPAGVVHLNMPASAQHIWHALTNARARSKRDEA